MIPFKTLKIRDYKDFCKRCERIYHDFWLFYAPFFSLRDYKNYLYNEIIFIENKKKNKTIADKCWEYLMGDVNRNDLYSILGDYFKSK